MCPQPGDGVSSNQVMALSIFDGVFFLFFVFLCVLDQVMALAIFDGVLLHILNTLAPSMWQPIKLSLCEAFNQNKGQKVLRPKAREKEEVRERERESMHGYRFWKKCCAGAGQA